MKNGSAKVSEWVGEREGGATVQYSKNTMNKYAEGFIPRGAKIYGGIIFLVLQI